MIWRIQWQSLQWFWLAASIMVLMLASVAWLYRGQSRSLTLLSLRAVALAALAASILRPVILVPIRNEQRGMIAVLVDHSRSMSVVDAVRSPAKLVQLAAALGALPESLRSSKLSDLRQQVDDLRQQVQEIARSQSELDYARLAGRGIASAELHLRDARKDLSDRVQLLKAQVPSTLVETISQIDGKLAAPPIDRATELIDAMQSAEDQRLYQDNDRVRQICVELSHLPRIELAQRALAGRNGLISRLAEQRPVRAFAFDQSLVPLSLPVDGLTADGAGSDLPGALRDLRQRLISQRVAGVIVLSDGRQVGGQPNAASGIDVPIFAISMSAPVQQDLAIAGVSIPSSAFVGQTVQARVDIRAVGYDTQQVEIAIDGPALHESKTGVIQRDSAQVFLPLKLERPGPQELTVRVVPLEGEVTEENNQVRRVLKVIADPLHVALLSRETSTEFRYLRDSLVHDPSILLTEPPVYAGRVAMTPEQILSQDLLILSDLPAGAMGTRQWDAITRLLGVRGGSVIIMTAQPGVAAGYMSNPLSAALLPWRLETPPVLRSWPGAEPVFRIIPGPDMPESTQWWDETEQAPFDWKDLPGVFRYLSMPPLRSSVRTLLVERDSGQPVFTEFRVGSGRAFFIGVDEFWRWRTVLAQRDPQRLWRQLVQYAAQTPFAISEGDYALDADPLKLEPGQPLHVRTRIASADAGGPVALQVWRNGEPVSSRDITSSEQAMGRLEVELPGLPEGNDELRLVWDQGSRNLALPIRVESNAEGEMNDVSGDEHELERLAHGQVLQLDELGQLPERVAKLRASEPRFVEERLWDSPYLFLFVLGCLGLEWALRNRAGLV